MGLDLGTVGLAVLGLFGLGFAYLRFWKPANAVRQMEKDLPAALFSMASYDAGVPSEMVLASVAAAQPEPLRSALGNVVRQIRAGVPATVALSRLRPVGHLSPLMDRVVSLLQAAHQSGADLSEAYRRVAQDAYAFQRLQSNRREAFAVQKYTLYAGAVLVPAVLGLLFSWGSHATSASTEYASAVYWGLQVYLVAFGVFSAAFVAVVEGSYGRWQFKAAFLALLALGVFHGVRLMAA
ncbi:type II secretion system F family protein [Candidatus Micrarchaeota archaeon]|nr:type II secretion system F family protein [Candidatus Micrarchaeota archaeon]